MKLAGPLISFDAQIYVLHINLVEQSEHSVSSDDLTIEIVGFKCLELREAILRIIRDFSFCDKFFKLLCVSVLRCIVDVHRAFVIQVAKHIQT